MKHSSFLFKKFVFVLCFLVLQSISAMSNDINKRINNQTAADMNFYNTLTVQSIANTAEFGVSVADSTGVERFWFVSSKLVVLSRDVNTGNFNLLYDGGIKASDEYISKSLDEIMGTDNVYPGLRLEVTGGLSRDQVADKMRNLHEAVLIQMLNSYLSSSVGANN